MISFDLECSNNHRFEGIFKDYLAFDEQLNKKIIECPLCGDVKIKRLFTGCSIQSGGTDGRSVEPQGQASPQTDKNTPNIFEMVRLLREYVTNNFENVGKDFADTARAIHYGIEKERNIYGESTVGEIKELLDEGVDVIPIPATDTDM